MIGFIVIGIIITVGPQTGAAINPGRYTGTLIISQLAGLSTDWGQAWVYWVADLPAAAAGVGIAYEAACEASQGRGAQHRSRLPPRARSPRPRPERERVYHFSRHKEIIAMSVATQTVKKFINDPENVVPEALAGIAAAHPDLVRVDFDEAAS